MGNNKQIVISGLTQQEQETILKVLRDAEENDKDSNAQGQGQLGFHIEESLNGEQPVSQKTQPHDHRGDDQLEENKTPGGEEGLGGAAVLLLRGVDDGAGQPVHDSPPAVRPTPGRGRAWESPGEV